MDRVEFGIKLEQINDLKQKGDFATASKVADSIDWRRVKRWSELVVAETVYEGAGRLTDARNICVYAYNRNLGGKRLLLKLTELSILLEDFEEAEDLYDEFVEVAPNDIERYILLYNLNKAKKAPDERLIQILEEYNQKEVEEAYIYELAELYAKVGRVDDCIRECDDLILWFNDGEYVEKALKLKMLYAELTKSQKAKLDSIQEFRAAGLEYSTVIPDYEKEPDHPVVTPQEVEDSSDDQAATAELPIEDQVKVEEKDYSIYDTQNIREELAKSLELIRSGIKLEPGDDSGFEFKPIVPAVEEATENAAEATKDSIPESDEEENNIPESVDTHEIKSADKVEEPEVQEVESEPIPEILNNEVDEPTKEIRINTHHWKRYTSVMVEDESAKLIEKAGENESGLPKYIVEKSVVPGVTNEENKYVIESFEATVTEEPREPDVEEEADAEPTKEIPVEEIEEAVAVELPEAEEESEELPTAEEEKAEALPIFEDEPFAGIELNTAEIPQIVVPEETDEYVAKADEVLEDEKDELAALLAEAVADVTAEADEVSVEITETSEVAQPEVASDSLEAAQPEVDDDILEGQMSLFDWLASDEQKEELPEEQESIEPEEIATDIDEVAEDESEAEEEEDNERNDFVLGAAERKYLNKYLFVEGLEGKIAQLIVNKKKEVRDNTSNIGNILITGKAKTDRTAFAINLFKALHAHDEEKNLKMAKTSASVLNRNGILPSLDKIKGSTLLLENMGQLSKEAAEELIEVMSGDTQSMLIIATAEDYSMNRIFADYHELKKKFPYVISIRGYTVNELATIAKEYARSKGYIFGEKSHMKLFLLLNEIVNDSKGDEVEKTKELVDSVIANCNKKPKKQGSFVQLKEKDF